MKINKSAAIRKQLRSSRNHSPIAVAKALKAKGISVSPGLVSVVKVNRRRKSKNKTLKIGHHLSIFTHAKKFIREAGGPEEAKNLIDLIHKIVS